MHRLAGQTVLCLLVCGAISSAPARDAQGEESAVLQLVLSASAETSGSLVRLGDIVEFVGDDPIATNDLADVVLFPAPTRGTTRTISRRELSELLTLCDLPPRKLRLTGADEVTILAAASERRQVVRPALHLIPDRSHLRTEPKAAAAAGDELSSAAPVKSPAEEPAPTALVRRNGAVTVHCVAAGVRVTTSGKSLADGAQGETIPVELIDSREKVLARVLAPQVVQIQLAGK